MKKVAAAHGAPGTNQQMDAELLVDDLDCVLGLGLARPEAERVVALIERVRRETAAQYVKKLDRAVELLQYVRAERDRLEGLLRAVEEVVTAPDYLPPFRRVPRFVMSGREVLVTIGMLERYVR